LALIYRKKSIFTKIHEMEVGPINRWSYSLIEMWRYILASTWQSQDKFSY